MRHVRGPETAISHKGYWHLSKTLVTQTGMTNQWLASTCSHKYDHV